jgi:UDP-N-acetylglucosamine acyltransferase
MIHPSAIIAPGAQLADDGHGWAVHHHRPECRIGEVAALVAHCVIEGHTTIGRDNKIYQFASLGADPQDKKYKGEPTQLIIGDRNTIREFTTFNTGTVQDKGITRIGDDNWIMAYVHVAHDCVIGDHNVIANSVQFAGHVTVGNYTLIGGISGIHQFVRVG